MNGTRLVLNPQERFTNRVDNYTKYRPGYPEEVVTLLQDKLQLTGGAAIADVGSGTGIFSELLLKHGYNIYCVEPNMAMREEAERRLHHYHGFTSIIGTGEQTTLPDNSVDLITVAQAFHWFDPVAAKKEFTRILKNNGGMALLWNKRVKTAPQMIEYEKLKSDFGVDYLLTKRDDETAIREFYKGGVLNTYTFPNNQLLDFTALKGQLLSASYMPIEGQAGYNEMMTALEEIFARYSKDGLIEIAQETRVYLNR